MTIDEVIKMTGNDVISLLKKQGLSMYSDNFLEEHVDGALLIELEIQDLQFLGIHNHAHQEIILKWLAAVKADGEYG